MEQSEIGRYESWQKLGAKMALLACAGVGGNGSGCCTCLLMLRLNRSASIRENQVQILGRKPYTSALFFASSQCPRF
jgi:hypothetical protein